MPNWKKLIISGSDAALNSLEITSHLAVTGSANILGDVTASAFIGDGSALTNITAEWDGSHNGDAEITGSLTITGTSKDIIIEDGSLKLGSGFSTMPVLEKTTLPSGEALSIKGGTVYITNNGQMGVGTPFPDSELGVQGSIRLTDKLSFDTALKNGLTDNADGLVVAGSGSIQFQSSNAVIGSQTERMRLTFTGLGIGTTTPTEKLTVEGNISGSGNVNIVGDVTASAFVGDGSALTNITAEWDGSHNGDAEITGSLILSGSNADLTVGGNIELGTGGYIYGDTTTPYLRLNNAAGGFLGYGTSHITVGGPTTIVNSGIDVVRFRSTKVVVTQPLYVGASSINDTPTAKLQVKGSGTTSATAALIIEDSTGTDLLKVRDDGNVGIGTSTPSAKLDVEGDINITNANISNQENLDVDTGTEVVATLAIATYTAGFFDFVIKKGTNVRSGTIYACHDGTSAVHTETTTIDLGDTSDVELTVDISGADMRLTATVASDDWSIKSLVRGL